ncbi:metalloregulator ArsR/SmtB family transcription factor [Vineibacter terrae]|uniref:Metalloregulator ArsR/SmtB family transcription factor n=1 Tax=Vineibacter terrae TaxID=2586908 RepID=A0A5C8PDM3_9HYPH|nr:metalloregulator ArsR/SmtB family transcription factor [Vineibacter terrae]TXL71488.1 metalloregulator ArsR/SmtB family transcription factor [Vineibacter terrae]
MSGPESTSNPKRALYDSFAAVAQALAHGHRLELLEHAAQGERSVEDLAAAAGLSFANASQHLLLLRRAGLVRSRKDGKRVLYSLGGPDVLDAVAAVRRIAEQSVADARDVISRYFQARDGLEPVSRQELAARLRRKAVTLLDVRPPAEFALGRLAGAINIPLKTLLRRLDELPRGKEIVAYCRGPYCVLSFEAVALLRQKGFKVRRLEDGYPEWKAAGLPVQAG